MRSYCKRQSPLFMFSELKSHVLRFYNNLSIIHNKSLIKNIHTKKGFFSLYNFTKKRGVQEIHIYTLCLDRTVKEVVQYARPLGKADTADTVKTTSPQTQTCPNSSSRQTNRHSKTVCHLWSGKVCVEIQRITTKTTRSVDGPTIVPGTVVRLTLVRDGLVLKDVCLFLYYNSSISGDPCMGYITLSLT